MKLWAALLLAVAAGLTAYLVGRSGAEQSRITNPPGAIEPQGDAHNAAEARSQLDVVLQRGRLQVGVCSTTPPMASMNDKGELVGFEIDMARQIAKDLLGDPDKVDFVVLTSPSRFPAVLSGRVDFGLCSTTVTGDRAARLAFTAPYIDTGGTVLARRDAGITRVDQLNDPRFTIALLNNPGSIERAAKVAPKAKTLILDTPAAMMLATRVGRATAFSMDRAIAHEYLRQNDEFMLLDTIGTPYHYLSGNAIYIRPGDFRWWLFLNTWVLELRQGSRYPQYITMYRTWLKKDPPPQRSYDISQY